MSVRKYGVLPCATAFYEDEVTLGGRADWLRRAEQATVGCRLVFLDPDTGLKDGKADPQDKKGPKFVFISDLIPYLARGQSVVIYQHAPRLPQQRAEFPERVHKRLQRLEQLCQLVVPGGYKPPLAAVFGDQVAFLVLPAMQWGDLIRERARRFVANVCPGAWALQE
jgi:hypothetical protein